MPKLKLQQDSAVFEAEKLYTDSPAQEGGESMRESSDPNMDIDDLIFDEDDGGPSER